MEAVGQLAGGVAHDFNNVMQVIMGNTQLQAMYNEEHGLGTRHLDEVFKALERGASLTRSLLVFSRKQQMEVSCFDLNTLVQESRKLIQRLITEDIEFLVDLCDDQLRVTGDAGLVQQMLFNLVTNARDAIGRKGCISIGTSSVTIDETFCETEGITLAAGRYAQLVVSDDGCGMNSEVRKKIFEPFFTTKELGKGTGLGLAMIHGTVKQMEGCIMVASEPGKGAAFRILLPENPDGEIKPEVDHGQQPDLTGRDELVMIVEDEEGVRESLAHILGMFHYRVLRAANADEAISLAREHATELRLVITDIILPGMNGVELVTHLRGDCPDLPALFVSGYSDEMLEEKGLNSTHLHKPVHPIQLLKQARIILDKQRSIRTNGA